MLHRTGKYATLNLAFGIVPLFGCIPIIFMREDSSFIQKWFSVFPIGLGVGVIFVTVLSTRLLEMLTAGAYPSALSFFLHPVALQAHVQGTLEGTHV